MRLNRLCTELRDKLRFTEVQWERSQEETKKEQTRADQIMGELEALRAHVDQLNTQLAQQAASLSQVTVQSQQSLDQARAELKSQTDQLALHEKTSAHQHNRVEHLTRELTGAQQTLQAAKDRAAKFEEAARVANQERRAAERRLRVAEDDCAQLRAAQGREAELLHRINMLELSNSRLVHLPPSSCPVHAMCASGVAMAVGGRGYCAQLSNSRLVHLLGQYEPYRDLLSRATDGRGSLVYIPTGSTQPVRQDPITSQEWQHWVPDQAAQLAAAFERRHLPSLDMGVLNDLLVQLNRSWAQREQRRVQRVRNELGDQIVALRRQLAHREPYSEVRQRDEIERLRAQLQQAMAARPGKVALKCRCPMIRALRTHLSTPSRGWPPEAPYSVIKPYISQMRHPHQQVAAFLNDQPESADLHAALDAILLAHISGPVGRAAKASIQLYIFCGFHTHSHPPTFLPRPVSGPLSGPVGRAAKASILRTSIAALDNLSQQVAIATRRMRPYGGSSGSVSTTQGTTDRNVRFLQGALWLGHAAVDITERLGEKTPGPAGGLGAAPGPYAHAAASHFSGQHTSHPNQTQALQAVLERHLAQCDRSEGMTEAQRADQYRALIDEYVEATESKTKHARPTSSTSPLPASPTTPLSATAASPLPPAPLTSPLSLQASLSRHQHHQHHHWVPPPGSAAPTSTNTNIALQIRRSFESAGPRRISVSPQPRPTRHAPPQQQWATSTSPRHRSPTSTSPVVLPAALTPRQSEADRQQQMMLSHRSPISFAHGVMQELKQQQRTMQQSPVADRTVLVAASSPEAATAVSARVTGARSTSGVIATKSKKFITFSSLSGVCFYSPGQHVYHHNLSMSLSTGVLC
ncbi:hypothetical protein PAPYR_8951 [Paratrimastix pyriformis]|uniref:Uncharacterized protein n=1 Tax=Paratrimastix pyriformis TaxID=342808 RepID=A0ABQ8UE93_9EUKA|nr:hypothetical protein PAPYR_8951 [Paratrimastix pyriformis]